MSRRPIVYSARYYSSPRQPKKSSYWHLYRINPDGTGRVQLTDIHADDQTPQWSPGGSYISFLRRRRAFRETEGATTLCICDDDGDVRTVYSNTGYFEYRWLSRSTLLVQENKNYPNRPQRYFKIDAQTGRRQPATESEWWHTGKTSPDGKMVFLDNPARLVQIATNRTILFPAESGGAIWLSNSRLLSLMEKRDADGVVNDYNFAELGLEGKVLQTWKMELSAAAKAMCENAIIPFCNLTRIPGRTDSFLIGSEFGGTSTGPWFRFLHVNLATHRAEPWGTALDPSFSPDTRQFVTTYARELVPYGNTGKKLYVQSLRVASSNAPDRQKEIVSGLVSVESAQWRPDA
ncbi:MAG: hypothetical protein QM758_04295 [Armatimonas sp.]